MKKLLVFAVVAASFASCSNGEGDKKVEEVKATGINIHHIHRTNRQGYKAGALAESMVFAKGEFIAI